MKQDGYLQSFNKIEIIDFKLERSRLQCRMGSVRKSKNRKLVQYADMNVRKCLLLDPMNQDKGKGTQSEQKKIS